MKLNIKAKSANKELPKVVACVTTEDVEGLIEKCMEAEMFGVDTETTGCDPRVESPVYTAKAFSVQVAIGNVTYFVPTFCIDGVCDFSHLGDHLEYLTRQTEQKAVYSNAAYDFHVLANLGHKVNYGSLRGDTQVMSFTLNSGVQRHGLKELAKRLLGADTAEFKDTFSVPKLKKNGQPGKAMRLPDLIEVVQTSAGYILDDLYEPKVAKFRAKLAGTEAAARKVWLASDKTVSLCAIELIIGYASLDPIYSLRCYHKLREKLEAKSWADGKSMMDYYDRFERPLTVTLWRMTRRGMALDKAKLEAAKEQCTKDITAYLTEFNRLAVKAGASVDRMASFNVASGKDIAWLFTDVVGVKAVSKRRKNGTTSDSWDSKSLTTLKRNKKAAPLVEKLLAYRNAAKIMSTYIDPLLAAHAKYKGHVHTNFRQTGTATGRLSSATPNLQNIPAAGRKDPYDIRSCFIASEDPDSDLVIGDIDQAQVEARLTAHFSQDPTMLDAIRRDLDLHSLTATKAIPAVREFVGTRTIDAKVLKEVKENFPEQRQQCKVVNFSVIYGTHEKGLSETLECSEDFARELITGFFNTYPGVKSSMRKTQEFARQHGYVRSLLRRYVYCTSAQSNDRKERSRGERQAFNYKIQGCLPHYMPVMTTAGYIPIGELSESAVGLVQPSGETTTDFVVRETGVKEVYRVTTTGSTIEASGQHRFMVSDGTKFEWYRLDELRPGMFIMEYRGDWAVDQSTQDSYPKACQALGIIKARSVSKAAERCRWDDIVARGGEGMIKLYKEASSVYTAHAERLAGLGLTSHTAVPGFLAYADDESVAAYLSGLFSVGGRVMPGQGIRLTLLTYQSACKVQWLLRRLGVLSRVEWAPKSASYTVRVDGEGIAPFHAKIRLTHDGKESDVTAIAKFPRATRVRFTNTPMPRDAVRNVHRIVVSDPTWEGLRTRDRVECELRRKFSKGIATQESVRKSLGTCSGKEAGQLLDTMRRMRWVEVTSIHLVGPMRTLDITIHGSDKGYVASGLVNHNSDADMMKIAMVAIDRDKRLRKLGVGLRLQVHDELVFSVPEKNKMKAKEIIDDYVSRPMEHCGFKSLTVETPAETDFGKDWASAKG